MKKMLSLAAMFAVLSYAAPASAELKIGGDASVRMRAEFNAAENTGLATDNNPNDNVMWQYRLRLKGSADLGDGYFFKTMLMSEDKDPKFAAGGWRTAGGTTYYTNGTATTEDAASPASLAISQVYFGRNLKNCNYSIGRIPLNSFNNPIFDLALYPTQPLDTPVNNYNYDRLFGASYGTKVGSGTLNTTLVVLDNSSNTVSSATNDGLLNDGYAVDVAYALPLGNVTIEPQIFAVLTNVGATNITPFTFGATVSLPLDKSKLSGGAFYTSASEDNAAGTGKIADYSGYLLRLKGESGPWMAWIDYNKTTDDTATGGTTKDYSNMFVWAQYKYTVNQSATGSFSLQPTLRYRAAATEQASGIQNADTSQLRAEMVATVTF